MSGLEEINWFNVVMRWMHIFSAVLLIGGLFFMRVFVMPASRKKLSEEQQDDFRDLVSSRWRMWVRLFILLFLVSGVWNMALMFQRHTGQTAYHALFGVKVILALGVFFMMEALGSTRKWAEGMRRNWSFWSVVTLSIAFAVILISGVLRNMPAAPPDEEPRQAQQAPDAGA